ncbi:CLUMA_CG005044, isoform A [Clunio marinus]|uniref:CLUMA_CG005044, isoform A n=1 Tax=Clunio marinus TaxID=568069 RepID=A0A1J1HTQ1_9DIPT|nr:CLUMA_CG005044, isoform A [Clunio marinus]
MTRMGRNERSLKPLPLPNRDFTLKRHGEKELLVRNEIRWKSYANIPPLIFTKYDPSIHAIINSSKTCQWILWNENLLSREVKSKDECAQ